MHRRLLLLLILILNISILFGKEVISYTYNPQDLYGDATFFIVDTSGGWSIMSGYLNDIADSVQFELILVKQVIQSDEWSNKLFTGILSEEFSLIQDQIVQYSKYLCLLEIQIEVSAKCSFTLLSRPAPDGANVTLPVKTKFYK